MRLEIPLVLPSLANARLHWAAKARIVKNQRNAVALAWVSQLRCMVRGKRAEVVTHLPCIVTLTRVSLRELDDDNLQGAFKGVRDEVAKQLGLDDRSKLIVWHYRQERGASGIRIEVTHLRGCVECQAGHVEHPEPGKCGCACHERRTE